MGKIRLLNQQHLSKVMQIIKEATHHMDDNGIPQWDDIYPDQKTFENDVTENTLYGYFTQGKLAAIIVLNTYQDKEYADINWKLNDKLPLVVHRLCVAPKYQGYGYSKELMLFAEDFAKRNNYKSIRLDAFVQNPVSLNLYKKLGYENRGKVNFRMGQFYVFEREL